MSVSTCIGASEICVVLYEQLRQLVLTGSVPGDRLGLILLLRKGITHWMTSRTTNSESHKTPRAPGTTPIEVPTDLRGGLVSVLASMALSGREEISI